jgi:hypothetical protein
MTRQWVRSLFNQPEPPPLPPEEQDLSALLAGAPRGFAVKIDAGREELRITYRRHGMKGGVAFLCTWLVLGSAGGVAALVWLLREWQPVMLLWLCGWAAGETFGVVYVSWFVWGRTDVTVGRDRLTVEKILFRWRRSWSVEKQQVAEIWQVKDGGEGGDSYPSWGLVLHADGKHPVLARQEYQKSLWLGRVLSCWTGLPFQRAPGPD